jgi:hypothetical protein
MILIAETDIDYYVVKSASGRGITGDFIPEKSATLIQVFSFGNI